MRDLHMHVLYISQCLTATSCYGSRVLLYFLNQKHISKAGNYTTTVETHGLCTDSTNILHTIF